jgi:hypothetical protein
MIMAKKAELHRIEELLRRHGATQQPRVEAFVSEVRSDDVPCHPPPVPPEPDGILGGIVVIWEFCLTHADVPEFHNFLRKSENFIGAGIRKLTAGANYRGTYIVLAGGEACCRPTAVGVCYRVIWTYDSLDAMAKAWSVLIKDKKSNLYKAMILLRSFWLRDPQRSEVRIAPAGGFFDPEKDAGDAFAKLTLDAAKLSPSRRRG